MGRAVPVGAGFHEDFQQLPSVTSAVTGRVGAESKNSSTALGFTTLNTRNGTISHTDSNNVDNPLRTADTDCVS